MTPRDVELAAGVDQDELIERADRWAVLARNLAQVHDTLSPDLPAVEDIWVGEAATAFCEVLRPLLADIGRLVEQMLLVRNALTNVQEDATPVRQALYRDVIGWQRDLAGIDMDERQDPLHPHRYQAQRATATDRWTARAQADARPLVEALVAGTASLATIDPTRPGVDGDTR